MKEKCSLITDAMENGYDLAAAGDTLIAPLTLYSAEYDSLDELKEAAGEKFWLNKVDDADWMPTAVKFFADRKNES